VGWSEVEEESMHGRRLSARVIAALAFVLSLFLVRTAEAQPATANSLQLGGGASYGLSLNEGGPNPWGLGLGLGIGYTMPVGAYGGVMFEYYFGGTESGTGFETKANLWDFIAEVGYDIGLGKEFVLRGKGDVGVASVTVEACVADPTGTTTVLLCGSNTEQKLVLGPGATFLYLGKSFSFSFDTRYDIVLAERRLHALIFAIGFGF
jgi:hypothetical protein